MSSILSLSNQPRSLISRLAAAVSFALQPLISTTVPMIASGAISGAGTARTLLGWTAVVAAPYAADKLGAKTFVVAALPLAGCALLIASSAPAALCATAVSITAGAAALALMRRKDNASAHTGVLLFASFWSGMTVHPALWLLGLLTPIMAWSRVRTGHHTLRQTVGGAIAGAFSCLVFTLYTVATKEGWII